MADIAVNQYMRFYGPENFDIWTLDTSSSYEVYVGSPMWIDASEDTLLPSIFDSGVTSAAGDCFLGFAMERATIVAAATEDTKIKITSSPCIVGLPAGSITDANIGDKIYMSDSGTFTATASTNLAVGFLHRVVDGYLFLNMYARLVAV